MCELALLASPSLSGFSESRVLFFELVAATAAAASAPEESVPSVGVAASVTGSLITTVSGGEPAVLFCWSIICSATGKVSII